MFSRLIHAIVLITSKCNLKCSFCSANWLNNEKDELNEIDYYNLFDEIVSLNVLSVSIAGGEPLLCPKVFDYISYLKNRNVTVTMSTNGVLFNKNVAIRLKECGLNRLQFSLDGPRCIHDKMRGLSGLYDKIINSIEICKSIGLKTSIMMTVSESNIDYINYMITIAKDMGVQLYIERMVSKKDAAFYNSYISKIVQIISNPELEDIVYTNDPYISGLFINNDKINSSLGGCTAGILSCTITSTGDVLACPNLPLPVGNIRSKSLQSIWDNSPVLNRIRNRSFDLDSKCNKCEKKSVCSGCRAEAYCKTGSCFGDDPICLIQ